MDIGPPEARRFILHLRNDVRRWETSPFINDTKGLSPHTIRGYARPIKAFWSWLLDEGYIAENSMARLRCPRTPRKIIPTFSAEQIQRLTGALDPGSLTGFGDYVIILVYICGPFRNAKGEYNPIGPKHELRYCEVCADICPIGPKLNE